MRTTLVIVAIIAVLLAFPASSHSEPQIGQPVPVLIASQLDGKVFDLAAQRGKVVIVSFWATWCLPCHEEMPVLDAAYKRYHGRGLSLIGISVDTARNRDRVVERMKSYSYPAAMMSDATANDFGRPEEVPVAYVIDAKGVVRAKLTDEPALTDQYLGAVLEPLLAK